jgi:integrase
MRVGAAAGTINRSLTLLRRAFKLAQHANEIMTIPRFELLKEAPPRSGFVDPPQFEAVVAHLPDWLQPAVRAMYVLGWRRNEIIGLAPHQVDVSANTITLKAEQSKSGQPRTVVMPADLRAIVRQQLASVARLQAEGRITSRLFHRPDGRPIGSFRKRWRTACRHVGFPNLLLHDFRRSAARNLTKAGVTEQIAMKILGHATNSMFRRYRIVDESDLRDAAVRLDAFLAKSETPSQPPSVHEFPGRAAAK